MHLPITYTPKPTGPMASLGNGAAVEDDTEMGAAVVVDVGPLDGGSRMCSDSQEASGHSG